MVIRSQSTLVARNYVLLTFGVAYIQTTSFLKSPLTHVLFCISN